MLGVCVTARSVDHFTGLDIVASWRVFFDLDCVSLCGSFFTDLDRVSLPGMWVIFTYLD